MKICIIGNGIIGHISGQYLSKKGHTVDCISPDIDLANELSKKNYTNINNNKKDILSVKFKRSDLIYCKRISDKYFRKKLNGFFALELACEMGLAKYWGANLALKGLSNDIKELRLTDKEWAFIESNIPFLDVQKFYKNKIRNNQISNKIDSYMKQSTKKGIYLYSSILAIWEEKCILKKLPCEMPSEAIYGSSKAADLSYNLIRGIVEKIDLNQSSNKSKITLNVRTGINNTKTMEYDYILIACGTIGSYRLVQESLEKEFINKQFDKLDHHITLSTLSFVPNIPYPKDHIGMSNFDIDMKINNEKLYINYFPFKSSLKAILRNKLNNKKLLFLKKFLTTLDKLINKLPDLIIFPGWWINRLYISNIYLPSDMTSSYINYIDKEIKIIGGYRSDFEKFIYRELWNKLNYKLRKINIFNLYPRPLKVSVGADLHYASTLSSYTDKQGRILSSKEKNIKIIDSSSSRYMPTPNPTLYFIARAIKLIRNI